jgi:hypothetical protein
MGQRDQVKGAIVEPLTFTKVTKDYIMQILPTGLSPTAGYAEPIINKEKE